MPTRGKWGGQLHPSLPCGAALGSSNLMWPILVKCFSIGKFDFETTALLRYSNGQEMAMVIRPKHFDSTRDGTLQSVQGQEVRFLMARKRILRHFKVGKESNTIQFNIMVS